jgi:undecaprenyl diphosphate synthase
MNDFITKIEGNESEEELLKQIIPERLPKHIAIIMDGNRRWAKKKGYPSFLGHREGGEAFRKVMVGARELGIQVLTVYAFSKENWRRSNEEVNFIMDLFIEYCHNEKELMKSIGASFHVIGNKEMLTENVRKSFDDITEYTKEGKDLILNICVNYGSRYEIFQAALKLAEDINSGKVDPKDLSEDHFSNYLYTAGLPDPDLLIRTSGELRISNYLLWQNAYSEFWFTDLLWPDFDKTTLLKAIIDYQGRERRFGAG